MPEPDKLPEWASQDVTDPSSGQPNVSEPPEARKDSGWNRREIPPRQWFNWLHRYYYLWTVWLRNISVPKTLDGSTTNTADDTGHTHNITKTTQAQAEAGTNDTGMMTALKTKQAVDAYGFIAANNLQEIEDAGAAAQAAARENLGVKVYTDEVNLSGGDFATEASQSIYCYRIDGLVTITSDSLNLSTSSASASKSSAVPSDFTPTNTITASYAYNENAVFTAIITPTGNLTLNAYDTADGTPLSVSTMTQFTISYYKHP